MAEELERMKRNRTVICAPTTRLLNRMDEEFSKERPNTDKLREMMALLSTKEESLIELDKGIEDKTETDDLVVEVEGVLEYQERIVTLRSRANILIQNAHQPESVQTSGGTNSDSLQNKWSF